MTRSKKTETFQYIAEGPVFVYVVSCFHKRIAKIGKRNLDVRLAIEELKQKEIIRRSFEWEREYGVWQLAIDTWLSPDELANFIYWFANNRLIKEHRPFMPPEDVGCLS